MADEHPTTTGDNADERNDSSSEMTCALEIRSTAFDADGNVTAEKTTSVPFSQMVTNDDGTDVALPSLIVPAETHFEAIVGDGPLAKELRNQIVSASGTFTSEDPTSGPIHNAQISLRGDGHTRTFRAIGDDSRSSRVQTEFVNFGERHRLDLACEMR